MWVRIDDGCLEHRKIDSLSDAAFRLWMQGLTFSARALTDGQIPERTAAGWAFSRAGDDWRVLIDELVAARLWEVCVGGYQVHDYLEFNPSREEAEEERRKTRERVARFRKRKSPPPGNGACNGVTDAVTGNVTKRATNGVRTPSPSPSPSPSSFPSPSPPEAAAARGRARDADDYAEVWRAYDELIPRSRSPSKGEREVLDEWRRVGVPPAYAASIIRRAATVPDTLIWYRQRVLERWADKDLVDRRTALLDQLAVMDPPPFPVDVAVDVCYAIEDAQSVEELEAIEREWLSPSVAAAGGDPC